MIRLLVVAFKALKVACACLIAFAIGAAVGAFLMVTFFLWIPVLAILGFADAVEESR